MWLRDQEKGEQISNLIFDTQAQRNEQKFKLVNIQIFSNALDMKDAYQCLQNANNQTHTNT